MNTLSGLCMYSEIFFLVNSLGMKDSWGPLKALVVASTVNIIGHIILCSYLGYGIAGAAWATMGSQVNRKHRFLFLVSGS